MVEDLATPAAFQSGRAWCNPIAFQTCEACPHEGQTENRPAPQLLQWGEQS
jgi:hypothetical protein